MDEQAKHTAGAEVFLEDGSAAEYVARLDGGHVVRAIYEHEDHEPTYGRPFSVARVFTKAPVERRSAEVAELTAQADALREEMRLLRQERADIDRDITGRRDRLREHGVLETLDNWIAGKITHLLVIDYGDALRLFTLEEAAKADRGYSALSLLVLKGRFDTPGQIRWSFEGRYEGMLPFTSKGAALDYARQHLETRRRMWRDGRTDVNPGGLADSYARLGLPLPEDIAAKSAETAKANAASRLERARKELAAAEADLAKAEGRQ